MRRRLLSLSSIVVLLLPAVVAAQKVPVGPQFQVNTYTTGVQGGPGGGQGCGYWDGRQQAVAAAPGGNFIVVWGDGDSRTHGQDGSYGGIFGQRYDSVGTPLSGEFQVNTYTTRNQRYPRIAADSAGNFVVVWNGEFDPYGWGRFYNNVRGQRFDSAGTPQGAEFEVTANCDPYCFAGDYTPRYPAVATDGAGRFIVVWDESYDYHGRRISGRRYDSGGAPLGSEFEVSQMLYPTGIDYETAHPDIAAHANGGFVVVWHSFDYQYYSYPSSGYVVLGRRFDSAGTPQGDQFEIQGPGFFETFPRVAADGSNGFVVVWSSDDYYGAQDPTDIAARRYDSSGSPIGDRFVVNTYTTGGQRCPAIASADDGSFVVTWHQGFFPFTNQGFGQQFDGSGAPVGANFLVNTEADQGHVALDTSVASGADGNFVVVWRDRGEGLDGDSFGVFGQRFADPGSFACTSAARDDCRQQTNRRRGAFRFRGPSNPARKTLAWRAPTLQATTFGDFGDPFTDTDYVLCVYDDSAGAQPVIQARMPAGGICNVIPCWIELSPPGKTIRYFDSQRDPDGIDMMKLRAGDEGRARTGLRARGENLALPPDVLMPPVIVQLQASNGLCVTTRYEDRIRKNEPGKFVARPGSPSGAFLDDIGTLLD